MSSAAKKIKWALVGLGAHADRIAQAIRSSRNGSIVCVASHDLAHARSFAERFGVPRAFASLSALLRDGEADAVWIGSRTHEHAAQCLEAIRAGRHVLCEKPMVLSVQDARRIASAARQYRVRFGVGFHLRWDPLVQKARRIIADGELGTIHSASFEWSVGVPGATKLALLTDPHKRWRERPEQSGGGAIMARGTHLFDLARFLFGCNATSVIATTDPHPHTKKTDTTAIGIFMMGGAFVSFVTSRLAPYAENRIVICGSHGRLVLDIFSSDGQSRLEWVSGNRSQTKTATVKDLYQKEVEDFADWVRGNKTTAVATVADGVQSVLMTEAFLAAARTGSAKNLPKR